jgi:hypothetical protein
MLLLLGVGVEAWMVGDPDTQHTLLELPAQRPV